MPMKKLLPILFLALLLLLVACQDGTDSTSELSTPSTVTDAPLVTSTPIPPDTEAPVTDKLPIPDEYYNRLDMAVNCRSIVIPAAYNEGIAVDIYPYIEDGTVYFLLPSRTDLSQVVYHLLNSEGKLVMGRVADFTDEESTDGKRVSIIGREHPIVAYRSDSPTLYLDIDETYGTIEDVQNDRSKETRAYGRLILECRQDIAEKYGWQTHFVSREGDGETPGSFYIKGRGNWTWLSADKQGYSIKLEKKDSLLGMSKNKKWALIGNQPDNTMLRNPLASYLSRAADMPYSPSGEYVDLYISGEYYGAFLLSEKVTVDENRVDIFDLEDAIEALDPLEYHGVQRSASIRDLGVTVKYWTEVPNPTDITGGYILEYEMADRYRDNASGFVTSRRNYYVIKSPEYCSYEQVSYIATKVQEMEDALYSSSGYNRKGKYYTDYIDLDSFIKKYWIDEIAKNRDGAKTSHYLYKPADSQSDKIFAGPVWDYDIAFGISSETVNPEGWFSRAEKSLYIACFKHKDFEERAKELFNEIFYPAATKFIEEDCDIMADKIEASMTMNYIRWDQLGRKEYLDYVEELKNYLQRRILWIKKEIS